MRKSDRLFQLTNILRKHQPLTAQQLAEKLMVSERTIYRYVDDLSASGIPIYGEPGIGYRLVEGFELPPLHLSREELEALITGVSFTASLTGKDLAASAQSLLAKIEAVLPNSANMISDEERVVRVPTLYRDAKIHQTWSKVHSAIESKRRLTITYRSLSDVETARVVIPLGLFYWGGKWTLGCWCELRHAYRDLRLDRIAELKFSECNTGFPQHVSLHEYMETKNSQSY